MSMIKAGGTGGGGGGGGGGTTDHNALDNLQGGEANFRGHLEEAELTFIKGFKTVIQDAQGEPVVFGYDPATGDIVGFSRAVIVADGGAMRGGNPLIALEDYPDGELLGGNPLMAAEDYYPYGHLYGGDPYMY